MNLLPYGPGNIEEIKQLFTKVFSDSEGQSEGLLIGNLAFDLMKTGVRYQFPLILETIGI